MTADIGTLLSLAREVGGIILETRVPVEGEAMTQAVMFMDGGKRFAERIRQDERERALSIEAVAEAVRAYIQAGKRDEDLLGAMRCAIDAAIRSSDTSQSSLSSGGWNG